MHRLKTLRVVVGVFALAICAPAQSPAPFSIIALPDTQLYAIGSMPIPGATAYPFFTSTYGDQFADQIDWVLANIGSRNIKYVAHLGDMVQEDDLLNQWGLSNQEMSRLDGAIPWGTVPGNHDLDDWELSLFDVRSQSASKYLACFGPDRHRANDYFGGDSADGMNSYHFFVANDRRYLMLLVDFDFPRSAVIWADRVLSAYPETPTILVSHAIVNDPIALPLLPVNILDPRATSADEVFEELIAGHDQIFLTLNGHYHDAGGENRIEKINDFGHSVFMLHADYTTTVSAMIPGSIRILEFREATNEIEVQTYSPTTNSFQTDPDSAFTLLLDFNARFGPPDIVHVTQNTTIAANDTSLDGKEVIVEGNGVVLTINGRHQLDSLNVSDGAKVTHAPGHLDGLHLEIARGLVVESTASIDVSGRGHAAGTGTGAGTANTSASFWHGGGAGHGGIGADSTANGTGGPAYDSSFAAEDLGSGGASGDEGIGGNGGGSIRLYIEGHSIIDGEITADGDDGTGGSISTVGSGGGGSGGSIFISTRSLEGTGLFSADGGSGGTSPSAGSGGGGSGGRIALYSEATTSPAIASQLSVLGAGGGDAGTTHVNDSFVLYVSAESQYPQIQDAIDAATALNTVIRVAPGTYESFTIDNQAPLGSLRIVADGVEPVSIDTETGPVVLRNAEPSFLVMLSGLMVGNSQDENVGVEIENSPGPIVLDRLVVEGGVLDPNSPQNATVPAVSVSDSPQVMIQNSVLCGTDRLLPQPGTETGVSVSVETGSFVAYGGGATDFIDVDGSSQVELAGLTLDPGVPNPPQLPGLSPVLLAPDVAEVSLPFLVLQVQGDPFSVCAISATVTPQFYRHPALDLAGFIDATTVYGLPIVSFTSATGEFAFGFQLGPALLPFAGVAFHFQAVVQNPTTPGFRWTNLSSVILVP